VDTVLVPSSTQGKSAISCDVGGASEKKMAPPKGGGLFQQGRRSCPEAFPGLPPPKVRMVKEHPRAGFGTWELWWSPLENLIINTAFVNIETKNFYIASSYCWGDGKTNKEVYFASQDSC